MIVGKDRKTAASSTLMMRASHGFWAVAFAFLVVMAYAALPTPLYVLYQQRDGFGPLLVTVVFAVYAVGVLASLLLVGHVSDWVGRRRVLCAALLLDAASALAFLLWPALGGLLLGRIVCGVATGMATATATAYLAELRRAATARARGGVAVDDARAASRGTAPDGRANVVATAANLGGMGVGPLLAGRWRSGRRGRCSCRSRSRRRCCWPARCWSR